MGYWVASLLVTWFRGQVLCGAAGSTGLQVTVIPGFVHKKAEEHRMPPIMPSLCKDLCVCRNVKPGRVSGCHTIMPFAGLHTTHNALQVRIQPTARSNTLHMSLPHLHGEGDRP